VTPERHRALLKAPLPSFVFAFPMEAHLWVLLVDVLAQVQRVLPQLLRQRRPHRRTRPRLGENLRRGCVLCFAHCHRSPSDNRAEAYAAVNPVCTAVRNGSCPLHPVPPGSRRRNRRSPDFCFSRHYIPGPSMHGHE